MKRRAFCRSIAAGVIIAGSAYAQRPETRRITWASNDRAAGNYGYEAFREGLREHGYVEGRDLTLASAWFDGPPEAQERMVVDLVAGQPGLIVTQGPIVRTFRRVETALPLVFGFSGDPIAADLVASFARPGRNMTGISFLALDLVAKRMELLKVLMPDVRRVAIIANPGHPGESSELDVSRRAAATLALTVDYFPIRGAAEVEPVLADVLAARSQAIVVFPDAGMMRLSERFAAFSREQRVPAISGWSVFAQRGNVLSYGPELSACFKRLAFYVDRIFKGARPADLPVELPTKVALTVNLQAARAIGLTVPPSLLARADEVIP